jgi:mannose-1-phosphate guanylyltransferase
MSGNNHTYVIILAGGIGKRFQPYSTPEMPKQFLLITDQKRTMIEETHDRVTAFAVPDHLFVSTNDRYMDLVAQQLPDIPTANVIGEPKKKNTAPAIALITHLIHRRDPDAVTVFLPSDHFIAEPDKAVATFRKGIEHASNNPVLVTFGIVPTFASPEFGYIHRGKQIDGSDAYEVVEFVEKPDVPTAEKYIASGSYYWNGGMFAWKASTLIEALKEHKPAMAKELDGLEVADDGAVDRQWLDAFFNDVEEISIDYAVMEKANNVNVFPFDCGWSDVGTWDGLADLANRFHLTLPQKVQEYLKKQM